MNKSNLILASVSAIIFTSILIIFSPNSQKLNFSSSVPSQTPSQLISSTPDPTVDWKTYENKEYGFSFKYPSDLTISENKNGMSLRSKLDIEQPGGGPTFLFGYVQNSSISEYIKKYTARVLNTLDYNNTKFTYITIDGELDTYDQLLLEKNGDLLIFSNNPQILSTFKFTDQAISSALEVAKKYLDASVKGDLETAKIYCSSMERTALDGYSFVKYEIAGSKADNNPDYYHVYVKFTDKSGKIWDIAPNTQGKPLEVYLNRNSEGIWKALTWYFYQ